MMWHYCHVENRGLCLRQLLFGDSALEATIADEKQLITIVNTKFLTLNLN